MTSLAYPFTRFYELSRTRGLREAVVQTRRKAASDFELISREVYWSLAGKRLPSERSIRRATTRQCRNLDDLVDDLRRRESPAMLITTADRDMLVAGWLSRYPRSVASTYTQADDICDLRFDLLGTHFDFGDTGDIDWHGGPIARYRWPIEYVERIDRWLWSDRRPGDYKPIWELGRQQYLVTLGKAYWLTGDERYAETCAAHVLSWICANPYPFGIHWYSALEIGIRLIAWGFVFQFLRGSARFVEMAGHAFVRSLYQQATHLRAHLTRDWPGRNNHIIGEAAALAFVGALFDDFTASSEWRETGLSLVESGLARQTHPDGVNREQAVAYHRFVLDFVLLLIVLSRRAALRRSPALETIAEGMLEYLMLVATPDGQYPNLGDADGGRGYVLSVCSPAEAARESLAIGAVLFQRPDFKFAAQQFGEGAFWLLGSCGLAAFESLPKRTPRACAAFPHSGQYVMRDGWTHTSDYAVMRCGEFGLGGDGYCAHAHCDLLSPILWIKGRPLLVDSGTYTYHGPWRDVFRSTVAHNTVRVDGEEQALCAGPFNWNRVPIAHCVAAEADRIAGRLLTATGVTFRRELTHPALGVWRVIDQFSGAGSHQMEWAFHLAPGLDVDMAQGDGCLLIRDDIRPEWAVSIEAPDVRLAVDDGWVSQTYGERTRAQVIRAWWCGALDAAEATFVWQFALMEGRGITCG